MPQSYKIDKAKSGKKRFGKKMINQTMVHPYNSSPFNMFQSLFPSQFVIMEGEDNGFWRLLLCAHWKCKQKNEISG
jgi:hypothetical protein